MIIIITLIMIIIITLIIIYNENNNDLFDTINRTNSINNLIKPAKIEAIMATCNVRSTRFRLDV